MSSKLSSSYLSIV